MQQVPAKEVIEIGIYHFVIVAAYVLFFSCSRDYIDTTVRYGRNNKPSSNHIRRQASDYAILVSLMPLSSLTRHWKLSSSDTDE